MFTVYSLLQSEKAQSLSAYKKFVIKTSVSASKEDVKKYLEKNFSGVKVSALNSLFVRSNTKYFKGQVGKTKSFKKFYVTLDKNSVDLNSFLKNNNSDAAK